MLRGLAKRAGTAAFDSALALNHERNLEEIIALVNHAIQSTRRMALGISPVTLERGGLLPALQTLVGWARDSYNIEVRLRLSVRSALRIGESAAAHLHLITQEAINNAVRHGRARSVVVTLRTSRTLLSLSITDDGVGIAEHPARGAGMGLKLMEYRSAVIGGVMRIKRLPGSGTRIRTVCRQDAAARKSSSRRHSAGFGRADRPRRKSVSASMAKAIIKNRLTAFRTGVAPSRIRPYIMTVRGASAPTSIKVVLKSAKDIRNEMAANPSSAGRRIRQQDGAKHRGFGGAQIQCRFFQGAVEAPQPGADGECSDGGNVQN